MRHGPAEDHAPTGRDGDRALTPSGRERVAQVAAALVARGEVPSLIVSSPLVRARQTAEIVADACGIRADQITLERALAPEGDQLALYAGQLEAGLARVLVCGHEPDLSDAVLAMTDTLPPQGMQKAMVIGLELEPLAIVAPSAVGAGRFQCRVRFVLDPKSRTFDDAPPR